MKTAAAARHHIPVATTEIYRAKITTNLETIILDSFKQSV